MSLLFMLIMIVVLTVVGDFHFCVKTSLNLQQKLCSQESFQRTILLFLSSTQSSLLVVDLYRSAEQMMPGLLTKKPDITLR